MANKISRTLTFPASEVVAQLDGEFQTTTGTALNVFNIPIPEGRGFRIETRAVLITATTGANGGTVFDGIVVRRPVGGVVTLVGNLNPDDHDDYPAGNPSVNYTLNTISNLVEVNLVGLNSRTINWSVLTLIMKVNA